MTERWRHAIDNGKSVVVLFIDFQKAFDSVSHPILLRKLAACGIPGELLEYLESYLSGRKQFTVVNGEHSQLQNICYGVPQGSILGPDCFSISVNDMSSKVCNNDWNSEEDLFADDCNAFEIGDTVDEALSRMKSTANNVEQQDTSWKSRNQYQKIKFYRPATGIQWNTTTKDLLHVM